MVLLEQFVHSLGCRDLSRITGMYYDTVMPVFHLSWVACPPLCTYKGSLELRNQILGAP